MKHETPGNGKKTMKYAISIVLAILIVLTPAIRATARRDKVNDNVKMTFAHPRLLFSQSDLPEIKRRSAFPIFQPVVKRLLERAEWQLAAPPLIPSITKRGEPDPPGEEKGLQCARLLQGRVLTYSMAFTLTGHKKYRDAAVAELMHAINDWRIWVDTAHQPPFDLMNGETCLTFGLAWDWLYNDLTTDERRQLREGVERRGLSAYLQSAKAARPGFFFTAHHNWNPVCNGGAAVLALALEGESELSAEVLKIAVPAMNHFWNHLSPDGGWDEGTGYWDYGFRYAFIAAEALRRSGKPGGAERFQLSGARRTGYFPMVFNPGMKLSAGFGDSNGRANDAIFYLLGRAYEDPAFIWFRDRVRLPAVRAGAWPQEALILLWRPANEAWLPEALRDYKPQLDSTYVFPSIGWGMMTPHQPDPPFFLAFKNGSLAANHTHLDLNHISIGYGDTMLAVELGSRPYPADYFSAQRYHYYEITTAGHNTVLIGGKGQLQGKQGKLLGPFKGVGYEEITGVADGAYEVSATRVRRYVVFIDKRFWIVLDEIQTPQPETAEVRFHTYGKVTEGTPRHWVFEQGEAALDVATPNVEINGELETPTGWIKPVTVLSLKAAEPSREHTLVTVLQPRARQLPPLGNVKAQQREQQLVVTIESIQVTFNREADVWQVKNVRLGK
ncbi:MAG TPA: heparinase II/III family protein [Pyrinomonadaceae bacterium]|nr:heparinase II/III family protein [Pyrinomonadaceae bacterium]